MRPLFKTLAELRESGDAGRAVKIGFDALQDRRIVEAGSGHVFLQQRDGVRAELHAIVRGNGLAQEIAADRPVDVSRPRCATR